MLQIFPSYFVLHIFNLVLFSWSRHFLSFIKLKSILLILVWVPQLTYSNTFMCAFHFLKLQQNDRSIKILVDEWNIKSPNGCIRIVSFNEKLVQKFNWDNHLQVPLVCKYSIIKYIAVKLWETMQDSSTIHVYLSQTSNDSCKFLHEDGGLLPPFVVLYAWLSFKAWEHVYGEWREKRERKKCWCKGSLVTRGVYS